MPAAITKLKHVEFFNLSGNKLKTLPRSIGGMDALENLGLANNRLASVPEEIKLLKRLTSLSLDGNPMSDKAKEPILGWLEAQSEDIEGQWDDYGD